MCHNRTNNRKINRLNERCLRIIYNDKQSSFIELLEKDNSVKHSQFYRPKVNSVYNGTERVSFLGPIIWDLVPNELKDIGNLAAFKKAIKNLSPEKCPCRLCKVYINNVGFI